MTSDDKTTAARRPRTWPKVLLALSLAMNLAVIGAILGAHFRDGRDARRFPPPDRMQTRDSGFGPYLDALPRDARMRIGTALRDRDAPIEADRAVLGREFDQMLTALRAQPYDPGVLAAVLEGQRARVAARVDAAREIMLAEIAAMTPDERATFADRLEARIDRKRGPH
ncbi:periplasmic heavy metal sensor [Maritimibacter fusiformis]|uniref:Periplasmic heavy metal sensor n=1 Tax=Maritimibacter fusiformis TaxID=2603819 RepID=A0A5D0RJR4_9RHOB|nr:periplasmic heavy metal sensor [Maritimibacter fusiformis]TYB81025.1 periplasmic heavy metal sensor [Maritimibacter fusiformis]